MVLCCFFQGQFFFTIPIFITVHLWWKRVCSEEYLKLNLKSQCSCFDKWLIKLSATLFKTSFYLTKVAETLMSWRKHSDSSEEQQSAFQISRQLQSLYWWFHMNFQWFGNSIFLITCSIIAVYPSRTDCKKNSTHHKVVFQEKKKTKLLHQHWLLCRIVRIVLIFLTEYHLSSILNFRYIL